VRAAGTKTHTRDRVSHINEWAWPYIEAHARTIIGSQTRLFPASWSRHTISDWHRQTITRGLKDTTGKVIKPGLGLTKKLPLKNSRHHWAVYMLRAGAPVKLVQEQLGHASAQLTQDVYGQFRPSGHDQLVWSKKAAAYEAARRAAEEALNAPMQAAEGH
jgi:integrase